MAGEIVAGQEPAAGNGEVVNSEQPVDHAPVTAEGTGEAGRSGCVSDCEPNAQLLRGDVPANLRELRAAGSFLDADR